MVTSMRQPTLETLGLGSVLDIFKNGKLPATAESLVTEIFGEAGKRGSLVISGANGIVGAGKVMQLGSRLLPFGVRVVALDFPNAPDGIGAKYPGLLAAFGKGEADAIMGNIVRLTYDGKTLPPELKKLNPRFLLEAIPEILPIKREHYRVFREAFPGIEIRSVTSGFPSSELGVGIAHPAFPHEINKIWETVETGDGAIGKLLWALGLIPVPVGDYWSFILDVLFCGVTQAALNYHHDTNMPVWKIDKYVRKLVGPNPCRAHDAIGAAGANFLTWSCLHHLSESYGDLFKPTPELEEKKVTGETWYPLNHFRPLVDWKIEGEESEEFATYILGALFQMTSLMLHESRGHLTHMNGIGELCAQFRSGILAMIRRAGADIAIKVVEDFHRKVPTAAGQAWHPEAFELIGDPEWQQLYVNAEHDGQVGVVTIAREAMNHDVNDELNRAFDYLLAAGIKRVILTGDFHLSTQMVGADTSEFYPALEDAEAGMAVAGPWTRTARRLNDDFEVSVAYLNGKRALGGMLELLLHCHYVVSHDGGSFGFPEVTLPVVPGMEGCHWPLRKAKPGDWNKVLHLLLTGRPVKAGEAVGWLIDYAGPAEDAIAKAFAIAAGKDHGIARRELVEGALDGVGAAATGLPPAGSPATAAARKAILATIQASTEATLADAAEIQARHSSEFMTSKWCRKGAVGSEYAKTMLV
jgi:enoyl-CoA hydratase/carnithine racemase/3-hydroxyacyl-CoA dehydrogenase